MKRNLNLVYHHQIMKTLEKPYLDIYSVTIILVICMIFFANIVSTNLFFIVFRSIFSLIFLIFLPGYLFIKLIFQKIDFPELVVLSVCLSICISILNGIMIHLLNIPIAFANIMNFLSLTTYLLVLLLYWKGRVKE